MKLTDQQRRVLKKLYHHNTLAGIDMGCPAGYLNARPQTLRVLRRLGYVEDLMPWKGATTAHWRITGDGIRAAMKLD